MTSPFGKLLLQHPKLPLYVLYVLCVVQIFCIGLNCHERNNCTDPLLIFYVIVISITLYLVRSTGYWNRRAVVLQPEVIQVTDHVINVVELSQVPESNAVEMMSITSARQPQGIQEASII